MPNVISLPRDPRSIPGVVAVEAGDDQLVIEYANGVRATVVRSPLATSSRRESFDVWLPASRPGFGGDVAPSKSPAEVIELLSKLAASAASI